MAAKEQLGDAHALDNNIVAMSNPDGRAALEAGTVDFQVASSSNLEKEYANEALHEVEAIDSVWPAGTEVYDKNKEVYDAVCKAVDEACQLIESNDSKAIEALAATEEVEPAKMEEWLKDEHFVYSTECKGIMQIARFMQENDFVEKEVPTEFSKLAFDNVKGN